MKRNDKSQCYVVARVYFFNLNYWFETEFSVPLRNFKPTSSKLSKSNKSNFIHCMVCVKSLKCNVQRVLTLNIVTSRTSPSKTKNHSKRNNEYVNFSLVPSFGELKYLQYCRNYRRWWQRLRSRFSKQTRQISKEPTRIVPTTIFLSEGTL